MRLQLLKFGLRVWLTREIWLIEKMWYINIYNYENLKTLNVLVRHSINQLLLKLGTTIVCLPGQIAARYFFTSAVFAARLSSSLWKTSNMVLGEYLPSWPGFIYFNPSVTQQRTNTDKQINNLFVSGFHCCDLHVTVLIPAQQPKPFFYCQCLKIFVAMRINSFIKIFKRLLTPWQQKKPRETGDEHNSVKWPSPKRATIFSMASCYEHYVLKDGPC